MNKITKLKLKWTWYFTLASLAGLGCTLSLLGMVVGWVTGQSIIILLLPFVACTLTCAYSMFKWLEAEHKLIGALKHGHKKRGK